MCFSGGHKSALEEERVSKALSSLVRARLSPAGREGFEVSSRYHSFDKGWGLGGAELRKTALRLYMRVCWCFKKPDCEDYRSPSNVAWYNIHI